MGANTYRGAGRGGKVIVFLMLAVFLSALIFIINMELKHSIVELSKSQIQLEGSRRINQIVEQRVLENIKYEDLMVIHKDNQGQIVLLQPNTAAINGIISRTAGMVSEALLEIRDESIGIPLGQLTGSQLLAAAGPKINVKIIPSGQVKVNLVNQFEQAGINQTRHFLYLNLNTELGVAVPYIKDKVNVNTVIPLAETIIVGQVPESYINFHGLSDALKNGPRE
ncbi:MAG: sporulation protein YunB [Syntrophomonadaceae bacterium]|jgi:sporulation protein YunB|nr:sporulation protein YunB [Syntrophomonadaceae bacterium]